MEFEWDPKKNEANILKHGVDFADAPALFQEELWVVADERRHYFEKRLVGIGYLNARLMVVVFTEPKQEVIRIISLRKANTREQKKYETYFKNQLGESR